MLIGIPHPFSFQSSNVKDETLTIEELLLDCQSPIFSKGLELQDGESVYSYEEDESVTPRIWEDARENNGDYDMDEVLFVPCNVGSSSPLYEHAGKLIKVTGKDGSGFERHERPYEAEEYGSYDSGMDWKNFSQRYMRVKTFSKEGSGSTRQWNTGSRCYYFFTDLCTGAWTWCAFDQSSTSALHTRYLRTIMKHSSKFDAAKDIKATHPNWVSPCGSVKEETYQFKAVIERGGYLYLRTHLNSPVVFRTWTTGEYKYSYMVVISPMDISGFVRKRSTNDLMPFDGKTYTQSVVDTSKTGGIASWDVLATEYFNTIALGGIIADSVDISVKNSAGEILFRLNNYFIQNEVDDITDIEEETTRTIHIKEMIPSESIVTIVIHGEVVTIGEIIAAKSVDGGFTSMTFKNSVDDLTPKTEDQWGNWDYVDGGMKLYVHSGTVYFPIMRYDQLNRLMKKIGGKKVVINSSDTYDNEAPDGRHIFDATMMIARFTKLELDSSEKNKRIGEKGKYIFSAREIV